MSKTLILMRHAKSDWSSGVLEDHDRPLNARGQVAAAALGDWLRSKEWLPGEVLCSTATRTRENLQRVPASVATLADDQLDALTAAGVDIRFLAARVPSLNAESSFGRTFPRFYIRGLGNTDFDLNASQPVSPSKRRISSSVSELLTEAAESPVHLRRETACSGSGASPACL